MFSLKLAFLLVCSAAAALSSVPFNRYYNTENGHFLYTTDRADRSGYIYDGCAANVESTRVEGTVGLRRYYNAATGDNHYTTDYSELRGGANGYVCYGLVAYIYPSQVTGTVPLRRYYNPSTKDHFFTVDPAELEVEGREAYRSEGITGYVFPCQTSLISS